MFIIEKAGHRELERYYSLFEMDFDEKELLPRIAIHRAMLHGDMELLLVKDEESQIVVAYALCFCRSVYGYVLLKYFGVLPWYREKGLGVEAMRLLLKRYADRQGMLAELTVFDPEDGDQTMYHLQRFFRRFGFEELPCDYEIAGTEASLLVRPIRGRADLRPVAHRLIRDFYSRVLGPLAEERMIRIAPAREEE